MEVGECSKEVARKISVFCNEIVYQDKIYRKMVSLEYEVQFEGNKSMSTEEIRQEYVRKDPESPCGEGRSIHRALLTWCLRWKKQGQHARLQPLCRQGVVGQCLLKNQGEEDCEPMAAVLVSSNIGLQITNQNVNRICRCKGFNLWEKKKEKKRKIRRRREVPRHWPTFLFFQGKIGKFLELQTRKSAIQKFQDLL